MKYSVEKIVKEQETEEAKGDISEPDSATSDEKGDSDLERSSASQETSEELPTDLGSAQKAVTV